MSATRIKRPIVRYATIAAIAAGLILSTTAAAAPPGMGFYECGPGECATSRPAGVATESQAIDAGDPLGAHLTP